MSQFFVSGGQTIGTSASASVLPMNIQDWFPLGWTGWISLQSKGLSRVFSNKHSSKASLVLSFLYKSNSHIHNMTTGKTIALARRTFVSKVMSLLLNRQSRLVIAFFQRSKRRLISWLQSHLQRFWSTKIKVCHCFHCSPICLPWSDGTRCHDLRILNVEF